VLFQIICFGLNFIFLLDILLQVEIWLSINHANKIKWQRLCYNRLTRSRPSQPTHTCAAAEPPARPLRSGRTARAVHSLAGQLVRSDCSNLGNCDRSFPSPRIPISFISILSHSNPVSRVYLSRVGTAISRRFVLLLAPPPATPRQEGGWGAAGVRTEQR
jgi:hypothetical protein